MGGGGAAKQSFGVVFLQKLEGGGAKGFHPLKGRGAKVLPSLEERVANIYNFKNILKRVQ